MSQRAATRINGVPRSTVRAWEQKEKELLIDSGLAPEAVTFFSSSQGVAFLHRMVIAAIFMFTIKNPGGISQISEFLKLAQLDKFMGTSYGSIQKLSVEIQKLLTEFAQNQTEEQIGKADKKEITLCLDETFFSRLLCLVAIEPVSNFIFLEKSVENRKTETWLDNMEAAVGDLPVEVVQVTSDEARALLKVARELEVPHSPDLFHILQPLSRATSLRLAKQVQSAIDDYYEALEYTQKLIFNQTERERKKRGAGRPYDFQKRIDKARQQEEQARKRLEIAQDNQKEMSKTIAGISEDYHPYSLKTGMKQSAGQIETLLYNRFSTIEKIAESAQLSENSFKAIKKSKALVPDMVDIIRFFHLKTSDDISRLSLDISQQYHVLTCVIPALYLQRVAMRASLADNRYALMERAQKLLRTLGTGHPLQQVNKEELTTIITIVQNCADLFQRSSSCVEGRNGRLSLFHHGFHHLTELKLTALTVVNNYFITRPDGTTAAERLFGLAHDNLFEWLMNRIGELPKPAIKRAKAQNNFVEKFYLGNEAEQKFSVLM